MPSKDNVPEYYNSNEPENIIKIDFLFLKKKKKISVVAKNLEKKERGNLRKRIQK